MSVFEWLMVSVFGLCVFICLGLPFFICRKSFGSMRGKLHSPPVVPRPNANTALAPHPDLP